MIRTTALLIAVLSLSSTGVFAASKPDAHTGTTSTAAPESSTTTAITPEIAVKKLFRQLGVDIGSETDPDLLTPVQRRSLDEFEWDFRVVGREDRIGVNALFHSQKSPQKMSFSFRQRMDWPAKAGVGPTRNKLYKSLGQNTPARDTTGYVVGAAYTFNHFWGVSLTHDEAALHNADTIYNDQVTTLGIGYSPLGDNNGRPSTWTVDPSFTFEKFHQLITRPGQHYESFGYSIGPSYYYKLDHIRYKSMRWLRFDRVKVNTAVGASEVAPYSFTTGMDVIAFVTQYFKVKVGADHTYVPKTGLQKVHARLGASLRITWSDFGLGKR